MHLASAEVHALAKDNLGLLRAGDLIHCLPVDADRSHGNALVLDWQTVKDVLERLGFTGIFLQSHDRQAIVTHYFIDEWEHRIHLN